MIARPKTSHISVKSGNSFGWFYCDKQVVLGNKKFCREKISSLCQKHSALHLLQQILTMPSGSGSRLFPAFLLYITSITIIMHNSLEGKKAKNIVLFNFLFKSTLNEIFLVSSLCVCLILAAVSKLFNFESVCKIYYEDNPCLCSLMKWGAFSAEKSKLFPLRWNSNSEVDFCWFSKPFYSTELQSLSTRVSHITPFFELSDTLLTTHAIGLYEVTKKISAL